MVDVASQIDAVTRELRTTEADGAPARLQSLAQSFPVGLDEAWEAMSTAQRISRWFLPVAGDLRQGGNYELTGNASGSILECVAPADGAAHYRVTWEFGGAVSWLRVRLTSEGEQRTRVELEHTAPLAAVPPEMWDTYGPGATGVGWDQALLGLALHLGVQDASVAHEDGETWVVSTEGQAFTLPADERQAVAHITDVTPVDAGAHAADPSLQLH